MAEKGAKAKLYDVAFRMYAEGKSLTDIEETLEVSRQTLSAWKAESKRPSDEWDEWDKARQQKRNRLQRLYDLFDRELEAAEDARPGSLNAISADGLSKLGAMVKTWEQMERDAQARDKSHRAALFLDFLRDVIEFGSRHDAELVKAVEGNFDDLIQWGREKYQA